MTARYMRVLPRDLFNEANLLKCYGHLSLAIDRLYSLKADFKAEAVREFVIEQDQSDGSISITNLPFVINGHSFRLYRPLNSRDAWPLYARSLSDESMEHVRVFDAYGSLSVEFLNLAEALSEKGDKQ